MTRPTNKQIKTDVIAYIARFSGLNVESVGLDCKLKEPPLSFDNNRLAYLTMSLRGYVLFYTEKSDTVLAKELQKSDMTVGKVVELIQNKVAS